MKLIYFKIFCVFLFFWSCKEKPTYNPFDNQFNIDESYLIKDKLDTIWDTCGYYSLKKKEGDFEISYAYFDDNLLGKALLVDIDTIKLTKKYSFVLRDSINSISFNPKILNKALEKFGYQFQKQIGENVLIINKKESKMDTGIIFSNHTDRKIFYRTVSFFNRNKKYKDWY